MSLGEVSALLLHAPQPPPPATASPQVHALPCHSQTVNTIARDGSTDEMRNGSRPQRINKKSDAKRSDTLMPTRTTTSGSEDKEKIKRDRNREWMRQARLRQHAQRQEMQLLIDRLETQRNALMAERGVDLVSLRALTESRKALPLAEYRLINKSYTEVEKLLGNLREEQYWLRQEIKAHMVFTGEVQDCMEDMQTEHENDQALHAAELESTEYFWFNNLSTFFTPIEAPKVFELVRESYDEIMKYMAIAADCCANKHRVLGWSDKRFLDGAWANFMLEKVFPHEQVHDLMRATWAMSSNFDSMRESLQPRAQRMKVLQVLNENTVIIARQNFFPDDDVYFCTIYLLFRLETVDGYIIGTRTIHPYDERSIVKYRESPRHLFVHLLYVFKFTHNVVNDAHGNLTRQGCLVQFGGRTDNGTPTYAQNCIMDVILAMLRWENQCVGPLYSLT